MTIHTQLSAVLALSEKATPGEWFYVHGHGWCIKPEHQPPVIRDASEYDGPQSYDEAFIRACANLIRQHGKDLLAAVEGWVSVDDRLPDLDVPVWACGPNDHPFIGARVFDCDGWLWGKCYSVPCVDSDGKWDCEDCEVDDDYVVTHWRPLPEPPAAMTKGSAE